MSEPGWEQCPTNGPAEDVQAQRLGGGAAVLPAVVASATSKVIAPRDAIVTSAPSLGGVGSDSAVRVDAEAVSDIIVLAVVE